MVAQIATGEIEDTYYKQPNKVKGGKAGEKARAEKLSAEKKIQIAGKGAKYRWKKTNVIALDDPNSKNA